MHRFLPRLLATLAALAALRPAAHGTTVSWISNINGSDFNDSSNWDVGTPPGAADIAYLAGNFADGSNMNFSSDITVGGLFFTDYLGWVLSGSSGKKLTLTSTSGTSGSAAISSTSFATISGNLVLGASAGSVQTFSGRVDISGVISSANSNITLNLAAGYSTQIISGTNTYTGNTRLSSGTVTVSRIGNSGSSGNLGAGSSIEFGSGSGSSPILNYNGTGETTNRTFTFIAGSSASGELRSSGSGALVLTGAVTSADAGSHTLTLSGTNSGANELSGTLSNGTASSMALAKSGAGTWKLSGTNTYTGGTTLSDGTLIVANNSALGTGTLAISGSTATLRGDGTARTLANAVRLDGTASTLGGSSDLTFSGNWTLNSATHTLNVTNTGLNSISGNFDLTTGTNARALTINTTASTNLTISGAIRQSTGVGSLTKTGTGTLTLTGTNSYTGTTTISNGTLVGHADAFHGAIVNNATLKFDQATAGTFSGAISGSGSLTKLGAGTLTLSGTNSYTGGTTISAGTLVGNSSSLTGTIVNNAALKLDQATAGNFSGAISGSGSLTKLGAGALTLSGATTYTGATTVSAGTLDLSGATSSLAGNLVLDGGTLALNDTDAGTLTLAAGKTFTMSAGTLSFTLGSSFDQLASAGGGASLTFTGGTLDLDTTGAGFSYAGVYDLFHGFGSSNNFSALTLSGYDTAGYTAALSNSGVLSFTATAVPEPATTAALLGAAGLSLVLLRRRQAARQLREASARA